MSGSTDAATIAERTRLEAELRDKRSSLDDTYYEHSLDSQSDALDDEAEAFETSQNDYIETLRESLKNTDLLVESTYGNILLNSDVILATLTDLSDKYGFQINDSLISPWLNASNSAIEFEDTVEEEINNTITVVNSSTSPLFSDLSAPWNKMTDEEGNPIYAYSEYAKEQMGHVLQKAQTNQTQLEGALGDGFINAKSSVTQYETWTTTALETVRLKAEETYKSLKKTVDVMKDVPSTEYDTGTVKKSNSSNNTANKETPSSTPTGNSSGVSALQEVLSGVFGLNVSQTGTYDSKTREAVRTAQFYMNHDDYGGSWVEEDGWYGTKTRDAIIATIEGKIQDYKNDNSGSSAVGQGIQQLNEWKNKLPAAMYAGGTMGTKTSGFAITDESWIGEEITLAAGKNGQLQYLKKGSAVLPSEIAANLVEWGRLDPTMMSIGDMSGGIQMMSNYVNKPEITIDVENFLNVQSVSKDTLPELEKLMDKKIDTFAKQLNASIKKFK